MIDYNLLNTLTLKVLQKAKLIEGEETDLQEEEKEEKEEEIDIQQETFENVKELLEEVSMEDYKEDSEEKLEQQKKEAEEHNNAFTVKKLGELLGRIQTLVCWVILFHSLVPQRAQDLWYEHHLLFGYQSVGEGSECFIEEDKSFYGWYMV